MFGIEKTRCVIHGVNEEEVDDLFCNYGIITIQWNLVCRTLGIQWKGVKDIFKLVIFWTALCPCKIGRDEWIILFPAMQWDIWYRWNTRRLSLDMMLLLPSFP